MREKTYKFKYKPGDAVRVRADLNLHDSYKMTSGKHANESSNVATREMCAMKGNVVHILDYSPGYQYKVKEDSQYCSWTDEMFEDEAFHTCIFHGLI